MTSGHFEGKTVEEHLRAARTKGAMAAREVHGTEMPGFWAACADAAQDSGVTLLIVFLLAPNFLLLIAAGLILWKMGRSARLGWARLERLHRLIEEERWEIQHHRTEEREELAEMYQAKGFSGKLLEEVVDVLMADDDRLLKVMLEEEMGLTLEAYEHPLRQALGAGIGVLTAGGFLYLGYFLNPIFGLPSAFLLLIAATSVLTSKLERNRVLQATIWNIAIALLTLGAVYFLYTL